MPCSIKGGWCSVTSRIYCYSSDIDIYMSIFCHCKRSGVKFMGILDSFRGFLRRLFGKRRKVRIGIYGPPNAGKTTLANRIVKDWSGEDLGSVSEVPHETRHVTEKKDVSVKVGKGELSLDIIDTPGVATKIDFHEFVESYGFDEVEGRQRAKEATEGVIEAIRWLDNVEGVILVMDSTEDPFTQVNITILGNLEARKLPVLIAANKVDQEDSSLDTIKSAFPQHKVVPISALLGYNMDKLYREMIKTFR